MPSEISDDKLEKNILGPPNHPPPDKTFEESVREETKTWRLRQLIRQLDKWGLEVNGIERIPPEHRVQHSTRDTFTMWLGANCNVVTFSLGTLGSSVYNLAFRDCVIAIVVFNTLAIMPVAYFSTFGARSGLRQLVFSRFAFGYWTCMIPGFLNLLACLGWATVNCIVGAQTIHAVSKTHPLPVWAGITIISILSLIPSFSGYKFVHIYERHSWIAPMIVFFIILGEGKKYMNVASSGVTGDIGIAGVFNFGATVVGTSLSWISFAADYTVHLPENKSSWKIFFAAFFGNWVPLVLIEILGAAMMTTLIQNSSWHDHYQANGIGGLLSAGLSPLGGFGHFLTVILGLSVVAVNIPNLYSLALTVQTFGRKISAIPRPLITLTGTAVIVTVSLIGQTQFETFLDTFLVFVGYWSIIFFVIVAQEHVIFRRSHWSNYSFQDVNNSRLLPPGYAAGFALACGMVGAILGMSQKWFTGPIAHLLGPGNSGVDLGFQVSLIFTCMVCFENIFRVTLRSTLAY
ncbi:permease for cytosine/purines, uracil, thiamine, allantoin-domain-containing protein [Melampsora americana]|nr:permease for cytosine/purines, uracil, thiamine, allantoin-domain-containing protein [Melampsora americana]